MNYYNEIKNKLLDDEIYGRVKDYSKERHRVITYYEVGKLLNDAGKNYGEGIIKKYSMKLIKEVNRKYSVRYLFDIKRLYLFLKVHPLGSQLTISHYRILFSLKNDNEINYYISQVTERNLSKRQLETIIKNKEYERLPEKTKRKLITKEERKIEDLVKNPILIKNLKDTEEISEKVLQDYILENIPSFLDELGTGFTFIRNEYKIKIGNTYNYIDFLLYNIEFNCYVVVELKVGELKKEHIGQIQVYMNYVDDNLRRIDQDDTIGIIVTKKHHEYIIRYSSDKRILSREYELV